MTIQSSKYPHPDDCTNAGRKFAQRRELDIKVHELQARAPHVAYQVCQSLAQEIIDENYPIVIDEINRHLAALNDAAITSIL